MKVKVCHISTVHTKNDIRIYHKECRALSDAGYDVTYISAGKHDEISNGINLLGVGSRGMGKLRRMTVGCKLAVKRALEENCDIYHIHDGELTKFIKKLKKAGKKVIYDSHEHLPMQIYEKEWIPSVFRPLLAKVVDVLEMKNVKHSDLIVVVADKTYERFQNLDIEVVKLENLPIFAEFKDMEMNYKLRSKNRKICYTGAVWIERGLDTMCMAVSGIDNCTFEIAGRIDHDNPEMFIGKAGGSISFSGYLAREDVVKLYEKATVGVCLFKPYPNNMIDPPTKIYEYMASGLPVVASNFESITKVVDKYKCGICVDPLDINAIRGALEYILDNPDKAMEMGMNGRFAIENELNWEKHSAVLTRAYDRLQGDK